MTKAPDCGTENGGHAASVSPRNLWARLASTLSLLQAEDFAAAEKALEGQGFHDRLPREVLVWLRREIAGRKAERGVPELVNTPSDYLRLSHEHALHPFRRIPATPRAEDFPKGMILPAIPGAGNETDFLVDASTRRAAHVRAPARRLHVLISNASAQEARGIIEGLAAQKGKRHLSATVLGQTGADWIGAPSEIPVEQVSAALPDEAAARYLRAVASLGADILVFLEGGVVLDDTFIERAAFLAETTDNLVQVLCPATPGDDLTTTFSGAASEDLRRDPAPCDRIRGFNFIVPARLFHRAGGIEARFTSSKLAAGEVGYRMHLLGAYFRCIPVPGMTGTREAAASARDRELFDSLCPRPGAAREGRRFERPRVSVYIPAHNAARFIAQAVDSVLNQDVPDIEVCIFDDGSSDSTLRVLRQRFGDDYRVVWATGRNGGIGFASNRAVRMTRAPYIAQLDSDDVLKPGSIRLLMEHLDRNPDVACCYGSCERISEKGEVIRPEYSWPVFSREKMMMTSIVHHLRMFRRSAWERTSGFREDIQNAVDYDLFLKLSEVGKLHHLDEMIYQRRWHGRNTSLLNEHAQTRNTWRVQGAALERLALSRDWQVSVKDPSQPRRVSYERTPSRRCVVFWPDYSQSNPYQRLLYRAARDKHDVIGGDIDAALSILDEFQFGSMVTFHLHWLNFVFRDVVTRSKAEAAATDLVRKLRAFRARGGKIVWTIHNAISHESPFDDVERRLSEQVAELADILHFHSHDSIQEVAETFAFPREKAVVSRHGSFVGVYPDFVDHTRARRALDIPSDADVLLFLGQIRPYKGLDRLIDAFRTVLRDRPNAMLLIAGEDRTGLLGTLLADLPADARARIRVAPRRIDDFEMQCFFRAADLAVFPYKRILTSGSLLLAMSFGVPAVISDVGMCREVLGDRKAGFLYTATSDSSGLVQAINDGLSLKDRGELPTVSRNARARAESLKWPDFSRVLETWRTT